VGVVPRVGCNDGTLKEKNLQGNPESVRCGQTARVLVLKVFPNASDHGEAPGTEDWVRLQPITRRNRKE
jgi:hypothetical protein